MKTQLIMPAAGAGSRLGSDGPKALVDLAGKPLLVRSLEGLDPLDLVDDAIVVVPAHWRAEFQAALQEAFGGRSITVADGGAERQHSVANGLALLDSDTDMVVIHDAARPFVSLRAVRDSIEQAWAVGAATVALPCADTILEGDDEGFLEATPDRTRLWACQTPQTFRVDVIRAAHEAAQQQGFLGTDDASLVRKNGGKVKLVRGSSLNRKITTRADLAYAEHLIRENRLDSVLDSGLVGEEP